MRRMQKIGVPALAVMVPVALLLIFLATSRLSPGTAPNLVVSPEAELMLRDVPSPPPPQARVEVAEPVPESDTVPPPAQAAPPARTEASPTRTQAEPVRAETAPVRRQSASVRVLAPPRQVASAGRETIKPTPQLARPPIEQAIVTPAPPVIRQPAPAASTLNASRVVDEPAPAVPAPARPQPERFESTAVAANTVANEQSAILATIGRYQSAYENLDATAAKEVWPSVNERALAKAFAELQSQSLTLDPCRIDVTGTRARASCTGDARYVGRVGKTSHRQRRDWTFVLQKSNDNWQIDAVQSR